MKKQLKKENLYGKFFASKQPKKIVTAKPSNYSVAHGYDELRKTIFALRKEIKKICARSLGRQKK